MTDKELYYILEPNGCWHTGDCKIMRCRGIDQTTGEVSYCTINHDPQENNPDFTTWEGFGWLWDRCIKTDWWDEFEYKHGDYELHMASEYIHPTRFVEAVKEFLGGRK